MKKTFWLIPILACTLSVGSQAQELIADPGFEDWDGSVGVPPNTLKPLTHWYNANGTSDHHHQLNPPGNNLTSLEPCPTGQGQTQCGTPFAGQGVLGCWKGNGVDGTREWAGTKLKEAMVANGCYRVSYEIQNKEDHPNFYMATNQWGLFFSQTPLPSFNPDVSSYANKTKQFVTCQEVIDSGGWRHQEFLYVADKPYTHAFLGYVGDVSKSTFSAWSNDWLIGFYVWFDEVHIERIDPQLALTPDITVCLGDSILLEADANFPVEWAIDGKKDTTDQVWVKPQADLTCTARTLDGTPCSVTRTVTVTVRGIEVREFSDRVCVSAPSFRIDQASGPGLWSGTGITDSAQGLFDPALAGPGEFLLRFDSDTDCGKSYTLRIVVEPEPELSFTADPTEGCAPLEVRFTETSPIPGSKPGWDLGDGTMSSLEGGVIHTYTQPGAYTVRLQAAFSPNCPASAEMPLTVHEAVMAAFLTDPTDPTVLTPQVRFLDQSTGPVLQRLWLFGDGSESVLSDPTHRYTAAGIYPVTLVVSGPGGCIDTAFLELRVTGDIAFYVPTSFSPNGDGINDVFRPFPQGTASGFLLEVYDRWGGLLYRGTDIGSGWDGKDLHGAKAETGLYVYRIVARAAAVNGLESPERSFSGEVQLMR